MLNKKLAELLVAGVAVLAFAVLITLDIKIPGSSQTASVIDAVTDTVSTDTAPTDSVSAEPVSTEPASAESTPVEPVSTEPAPTAPADTSVLEEILQILLPSSPIENTAPVFVEPAPAPAVTKGISGFKVFVLPQDTLELGLNSWFVVQQGIVIDDIKVDGYDGETYLVAISYHTGDFGNLTTRVKFFKSEGLDNLIESPIQAFLSSLDSSKRVRFVVPIIGVAGSVFILIVYE